MSTLQQDLAFYRDLIFYTLNDIATKDCSVVLYSDYVYKYIPSQQTEYIYTLYPSMPILHITVISFSKRKYAKKIRNEIKELIECIVSDFRVKVHMSWSRGIKEYDYNHLQTTRIGAYIVKYIDGKTSIIENAGTNKI